MAFGYPRGVSDPPIDGCVDPAFAAVREALLANFAAEQELGAAVCIVARGRAVVDLWAGWQDAGRTHAWQRDTLVNVYSVGKGVAAALVLALAERGLLDLDARVADRWPEFPAEGKGELRVRDLLSHRAGLPAVHETLAGDDWARWERVTRALAAQRAWWPPGESRFGLGFQLPMPERPIGASPPAFGHFGYGGSLGFADPDAGLAFAYAMNRPGERWQTERVQRLVDALYASL